MPLDLLVGPVAALALALLVGRIFLRIIELLWAAHLAHDARDQQRADAAEAELRAIIAELRTALKKAKPL